MRMWAGCTGAGLAAEGSTRESKGTLPCVLRGKHNNPTAVTVKRETLDIFSVQKRKVHA